MIDWWNVLTHSLWIIGLAIELAVLSYKDWSSFRSGEGFGAALRRTVHNPIFLLGLVLACLGAGLGITVWWRRVLWFVLGAALVCIIARMTLSRPEGDPS